MLKVIIEPASMKIASLFSTPSSTVYRTAVLDYLIVVPAGN